MKKQLILGLVLMSTIGGFWIETIQAFGVREGKYDWCIKYMPVKKDRNAKYCKNYARFHSNK